MYKVDGDLGSFTMTRERRREKVQRLLKWICIGKKRVLPRTRPECCHTD